MRGAPGPNFGTLLSLLLMLANQLLIDFGAHVDQGAIDSWALLDFTAKIGLFNHLGLLCETTTPCLLSTVLW